MPIVTRRPKSTPSIFGRKPWTKCWRDCSPSVTMSIPASSWSRRARRTASRWPWASVSGGRRQGAHSVSGSASHGGLGRLPAIVLSSTGCPRARHRGARVRANDSQEPLTELVALPLAHSLDLEQRAGGGGPEAGHVPERGVAEDHVRRHAPFRAEAPAQLGDARQDLRRDRIRALHARDLAEAHVAGPAARRRVLLAEVGDESPVPANGVLAEREHLAELSERARGRSALGLEDGFPQTVVGAAREEQALRFEP